MRFFLCISLSIQFFSRLLHNLHCLAWALRNTNAWEARQGIIRASQAASGKSFKFSMHVCNDCTHYLFVNLMSGGLLVFCLNIAGDCSIKKLVVAPNSTIVHTFSWLWSRAIVFKSPFAACWMCICLHWHCWCNMVVGQTSCATIIIWNSIIVCPWSFHEWLKPTRQQIHHVCLLVGLSLLNCHPLLLHGLLLCLRHLHCHGLLHWHYQGLLLHMYASTAQVGMYAGAAGCAAYSMHWCCTLWAGISSDTVCCATGKGTRFGGCRLAIPRLPLLNFLGVHTTKDYRSLESQVSVSQVWSSA